MCVLTEGSDVSKPQVSECNTEEVEYVAHILADFQCLLHISSHRLWTMVYHCYSNRY